MAFKKTTVVNDLTQLALNLAKKIDVKVDCGTIQVESRPLSDKIDFGRTQGFLHLSEMANRTPFERIIDKKLVHMSFSLKNFLDELERIKSSYEASLNISPDFNEKKINQKDMQFIRSYGFYKAITETIDMIKNKEIGFGLPTNLTAKNLENDDPVLSM